MRRAHDGAAAEILEDTRKPVGYAPFGRELLVDSGRLLLFYPSGQNAGAAHDLAAPATEWVYPTFKIPTNRWLAADTEHLFVVDQNAGDQLFTCAAGTACAAGTLLSAGKTWNGLQRDGAILYALEVAADAPATIHRCPIDALLANGSCDAPLGSVPGRVGTLAVGTSHVYVAVTAHGEPGRIWRLPK